MIIDIVKRTIPNDYRLILIINNINNHKMFVIDCSSIIGINPSIDIDCHRLLSIVINSRSNFQALPYLVWQIVWKIFSNLYHLVLSCFRNIPCSCWCSIQVSLQSVIATVNTKCQECENSLEDFYYLDRHLDGLSKLCYYDHRKSQF